MAERGPNRARNENLKTEVSFSNRGAELELGKLVRLPYIRKISNNPSSSNSHSHNHPGHNHHNHNSQNNPLERRSLENRETRLMRNSNKELHLLQHTYLNTLTLQEIELCRDSSAEKDVLPKINPHQLLMLREKSLEALEPSLANREKKSLTKMDFTDKVRDSEKIKDYRLGPLVGKGTYSVVRAGKNREGRRVAIKTYLRTSLSNEDRRKNLENEISVLSSLQHPGILQYHECLETEKSISIVTQLLENRSLSDYAKGECFQTIPEDIIRVMMRQLVRALAHCHSRDIVHRDLKMENVLISKEMRVKLIDFGFSLQLPKENHILYDYCGTPSFIAPEVTQREGYYGKPADVWSLGVLIYRLATGIFPFSTTKEKTLLSKSIKSELKLPGEVTPELAALLTQMLSINFWKRPTAEQILASEWLSMR